MSTQRIPTSCIVAVKIAWACRGGAKSVHTCWRIFLSFSSLSFSFCSTFKLFICFYSTTPTPSSQGFMRMKWAQLLSFSFFFFSFFLSFFFFAFHRFSLPKEKELAIISLMMFVSGCVQKMASKIASFFLRLNFWVLAHDCDQVERKCDQKNGTRDNSATGTEKIFRALQLQILPKFLSEEGVTHRNVGDYSCHLFRHPFVSQIKIYPKRKWPRALTPSRFLALIQGQRAQVTFVCACIK